MARQQINFAGITPQANQPQQTQAQPMATVDKGAYKSVGIGLKQQELDEVGALAEDHNMSRNSILRLAVIRLLAQVRAGECDVEEYKEQPTPQKQRLKHDL